MPDFPQQDPDFPRTKGQTQLFAHIVVVLLTNIGVFQYTADGSGANAQLCSEIRCP